MEQFNGEGTAGEEPVLQRKEIPERIGETIGYDVLLGRIRLGTARYRYLSKTKLEDETVHRIAFETKVVRFHDRETIYYDAKTFLPLVVERKVSQFLKPEKIREVYDQENFKLTIIKKRFMTEEIVIKKNAPIHNSILLPFFVRDLPGLDIGWSFKVNLPQRHYTINLVAIETVEVPAGNFEAFYFESVPRQIKIWISSDERRIPLKLEGTGGMGYKLLMREYSIPKQAVN